MTTVSARPGLLSRLKLTEPVLLYVYGIGVVALLGLTLAGVITEEWADYWKHALGVVLLVGPSGWAARASVYSPAGMVTALTKSRGSWGVSDHAA